MTGAPDMDGIVVHVGMHKTGTSAFQAALTARAEALAAAGLAAVTPTTPELAGEGEPPERLLAAVAAARARGARRLVLSHENLSIWTVAELARLRAGLGAGPVRAVAVFRHWTGWLPSRWAQSAKRRDAQSLPRFLARTLDPAGPPPRDAAFHTLPVRLRAAGFDGPLAVSYDEAAAGGRLVATLAEACGVAGALEGWEARVHVTADLPVDVEVLRLFNGVRAEAEGRPANAMHDRLSGRVERVDAFFGDALAVRAALAAEPALAAELAARLAAERRVVEISPADVAAWEARLEAEIGAAAANRRDGRLFPEARARRLEASALEVEALEPALRAWMREALARGRAAAAAPAPRAGRLRRLARRVRRRLGV